MEIIATGKLRDGTEIRIEDWSKRYDCFAYADHLAAYPRATASGPGYFAPRRNEVFRASFVFDDAASARQAFDRLCAGEAMLKDYAQHLQDRRHMDCL